MPSTRCFTDWQWCITLQETPVTLRMQRWWRKKYKYYLLEIPRKGNKTNCTGRSLNKTRFFFLLNSIIEEPNLGYFSKLNKKLCYCNMSELFCSPFITLYHSVNTQHRLVFVTGRTMSQPKTCDIYKWDIYHAHVTLYISTSIKCIWSVWSDGLAVGFVPAGDSVQCTWQDVNTKENWSQSILLPRNSFNVPSDITVYYLDILPNCTKPELPDWEYSLH